MEILEITSVRQQQHSTQGACVAGMEQSWGVREADAHTQGQDVPASARQQPAC